MMKKILLNSLILLLSSFLLLQAGDVSRLGTTSGTQLLIPVGARSLAMGGAPLGMISGAEATFWNPAGISASPKSEVLFNNMQYIADIDVNYLSLTFNGGNIGAFGLDIKSLSFGRIDETTELLPNGTGNTYTPTFVVSGLTYARRLTDRITAGVTGKVVYESIMETSASTLALDMGVQYTFGQKLFFGVVMKNVGGKLKYNGRNLERQYPMQSSSLITDDGFFRGVPLASDIPSTFSVGVSYLVDFNEENAVVLNGTFNNANAGSDLLSGGLEYGFRDLFFLRGGYGYNLQNSDDNVFGASFGAGIKYPIGNFDFYFDYAYRQLTDYFDANNIFTIKFGL
ncbi:MAG: PorV/PorQ family protein [Calditrichae bacterium]|nr:PorV/PorQ family protein [Calditrichia bacterium]